MNDHNVFFVPSQLINGNEVVMRGSEVRHIRNVLRRKKGEHIMLTDGQGYKYQVEICDIQKSKITATILKKQNISKKILLEITIGFVPVKGLRNDIIIEKCTELGVVRFIVFSSEHAVVRDIGEKKIERFRKIAQSAMVQSQQYYMPEVRRAEGIEEMLRICEGYDLMLVADPRGRVEVSPGARKVLLVIGPEGGFTESEMDLFAKRGALLCGLGPTRLRSETAAVVGVTKILVGYGML
jgi:16S rRNA (uracil1498-N3)-methyltransferase